jgi:predicted nucleic acid-binding protein
VLRGREAARDLLASLRRQGPLHASEITRAEVLGGARPREIEATRVLLSTLTWHSVDRAVSERAAELARSWRASHSGIDLADYLIAASALEADAELFTRNVKHFPMFAGLASPY